MNEQPQAPEGPNLQPNDSQTPTPVAFDSTGRPLYAAPPPPGYVEQNVPQVVHMSRAVVPEKPVITPEVKGRHDASVKSYPTLNLSDEEYIISDVARHPIGMAGPIVLSVFMLAIIATVLFNFVPLMTATGIVPTPPMAPVLLGGVLLAALFLIGTYIAIWIYTSNRFFLTNESVIQEIQTGLFTKREQTVSLANIEDASFRQNGIVQLMFNYGSIRLSTEGDETTYRFSYVRNPKAQIALLNNAVEAFKNGRPVEEK